MLSDIPQPWWNLTLHTSAAEPKFYVQDIIIGNIPGASGVHPNLVNTKATVTPDKVDSTQSLHTRIPKAVPEPITNSEICLSTNISAIDVNTTTDMSAAVQTRAMVVKESKPPKPLKVMSVPGLDIGPEELKVKQKADESLKKYRELVDKPIEDGKPQFFEKRVHCTADILEDKERMP